MTCSHIWEPVPLAVRQYACACGATGWKDATGEIREHKKQRERRGDATVKDAYRRGEEIVGGHVQPKRGAE